VDLSVVIICCDDPHVFATLDSIDVDVPVIVSLVPDQDLEAGLRARGVKVTHSTRGNYSISCNRGLASVQTSRAFIVDSDCTLGPGCLTRIDALLDEVPLARARVYFEATPQVRFSDRIAQLRDAVNNGLPIRAYTPGLGLHLDIAPAMGGYFFDERIFWACDSEFNHRAQQAGLRVTYSPEAIISHGPITLSHELRSAFKLGMGNRVQVKLGLRPPYENPEWLVKRTLGWLLRGPSKGKRLHLDPVRRLIHWGWTLAFYAGYYSIFFWRPENIVRQ
jgi:hypothetical protein